MCRWVQLYLPLTLCFYLEPVVCKSKTYLHMHVTLCTYKDVVYAQYKVIVDIFFYIFFTAYSQEYLFLDIFYNLYS